MHKANLRMMFFKKSHITSHLKLTNWKLINFQYKFALYPSNVCVYKFILNVNIQKMRFFKKVSLSEYLKFTINWKYPILKIWNISLSLLIIWLWENPLLIFMPLSLYLPLNPPIYLFLCLQHFLLFDNFLAKICII